MNAIPLGVAALTAGLVALLPLPARALERLYINGSILTMAGERPSYVEALGVENGRIVFSGPRDRGLALRTASTRIIDLQTRPYCPDSGKDVPSIIAALKTCASERGLKKGRTADRLWLRRHRDARWSSAQPRRPRRGVPREPGADRSRLDAWRGAQQPRPEEIRHQRIHPPPRREA